MGFGDNDRGVSFTFGANEVSKFLKRNNLSLIVRAHQVITNLIFLDSLFVIVRGTYMFIVSFFFNC